MGELAQGMASKRASIRAFWYRHIFGIVAGVCSLFVVLTTMAMMLYPGGTIVTASSHGYHFFVNFFSDLGQTRTQSGANNYPSMILFALAMTTVGCGLGAFFVAFDRFFASRSTVLRARRINRAATAVGVVAALCFVGVGATPYNLFYPEHQTFVQWAFRLLLAAVILEVVAIRLTRGIPASLLWVNMAFVVILFGYLMLMMYRPASPLISAEIHAAGQKIIAYTAVASIFTQALLVRWHLARPPVAAPAVAVVEQLPS